MNPKPTETSYISRVVPFLCPRIDCSHAGETRAAGRCLPTGGVPDLLTCPSAHAWGVDLPDRADARPNSSPAPVHLPGCDTRPRFGAVPKFGDTCFGDTCFGDLAEVAEVAGELLMRWEARHDA